MQMSKLRCVLSLRNLRFRLWPASLQPPASLKILCLLGLKNPRLRLRSPSLQPQVPSQLPSWPVKILKLTCVLAAATLLISTLLPWLAERGWAGKVVQDNLRHGRDATALFYTESERVGEILKADPASKKIEPPLRRRQAVKR